jgi:predicted DNA-binding protein (UPF0251 family)
MTSMESVGLSVDEFEAIRLKDLEGLEQTAAADSMRISQPTFHRVIEAARKKVADALVNGKAIRIEGREHMPDANRKFKCLDCGHEWEEPYGRGRPSACPKCGNKNIHRASQDKGYARLGRGHRGRFEI